MASPRWRVSQTRCIVAFLVALLATAATSTTNAQSESLKIGIIGTGNVGGTLARYWAAAGHELVISSRNPGELEPLADELGPRVRAASPREAAAYGDVILISVPYGAISQIGRDYSDEMAGKIVLDTGNPFSFRDGQVGTDAIERGAGIVTAEHLPGTRLVRAFNSLGVDILRTQSNRAPERLAMPIAADNAEAIRVAERLVRDAGFDPVLVGGLEDAQLFDVGHPLYSNELTAREMRELISSLDACWGWIASVSSRLCRWLF